VDVATQAGDFEGPGVYIDPLEHNDLRDLFGNLPENWIDQIGGFFWFPEFPKANGTVLTRAFENKPVVLPLNPVYALAPEGATVVAMAVLGYNRDYINDEIPDWAGDQFTTGYPFWWKIWNWDLTVDGEAVIEAVGSHGQKLGYVLIPLPNRQPAKFTVTTTVTGSGTVSGGGVTVSAGTNVTLTATASSGWRFDHWEGGHSGSTNPAVITVNSNISITVVFLQTTPPTGKVRIDYSISGSANTFTETLSLQSGLLSDALANPPSNADSRTVSKIGTLFMFDAQLNRYLQNNPGAPIDKDGLLANTTYRAVPYVVFEGDSTRYFFNTSKVDGTVNGNPLQIGSDGQNWNFRF
jgi:hypothetical protein